MKSKEIHDEVLRAENRIRDYIRETPLEHDIYLSRLGRCNVFLKMENLQLSGSFKLRGAFNRLLALREQGNEAGVVAASSGNHAAAVAYAAKQLKYPASVFVPEIIVPPKLEILKLFGVEPVLHGMDMEETEAIARATAREENKTYVSPYNDRMVLAGQGTTALEMLRQNNEIDTVVVPVGGGGLMSGIAGFLKTAAPHIRIIGCQPEASPAMAEAVKAGKIVPVEHKSTLSDGTAGGIEPGAITFDICKNYVDEYVLISEKEIEDAIRLFLAKTFMLIEGAAAMPVAAFVKMHERFKDQNTALIISGKKISLDRLSGIICRRTK